MDQQPKNEGPLTRRIREARMIRSGTVTTDSERAQMRRALWKKGIPAGGWVDRALRGDLR